MLPLESLLVPMKKLVKQSEVIESVGSLMLDRVCTFICNGLFLRCFFVKEFIMIFNRLVVQRKSACHQEREVGSSNPQTKDIKLVVGIFSLEFSLRAIATNQYGG